jgi:hypothetical protein
MLDGRKYEVSVEMQRRSGMIFTNCLISVPFACVRACTYLLFYIVDIRLLCKG